MIETPFFSTLAMNANEAKKLKKKKQKMMLKTFGFFPPHPNFMSLFYFDLFNLTTTRNKKKQFQNLFA